MPKKYATTTTTLVIVESPAKCKKIEEYLGTGYKCLASYGHLRELPSLKNIDVENNFAPTYLVINNDIKQRNIEVLRKEIKSAREVILATDDDREGEAIAWHLCELFKLNVQKTKRIIFHEITETAIKAAIENPRTIDMNLVQAQQARQILDVLVGFKVSPVLWKLVATPKGKDNSLSAGRCQTPALKLVYENQQEINQCRVKQVFNVVGYFTNSNLPFDLTPSGKIDSETEMIDFLSESTDYEHIYSCSKPEKIEKQPPEPFTTSRLQQVASNELHYSPKETMRLCQILYEGGYITYMRTDSKVYSAEFIADAAEYIEKTYSQQYFNGTLLSSDLEKKSKKTKKKTKETIVRQEAHEAIRPTNISLQQLPEDMDSKERRMYKLIWTNTLESCMVAATFNKVSASITAPLNMTYHYSAELIDFPGWKIVENKFNKENKDYLYLQSIKQNSPIPYKKVCSRVSMKGNIMHYTEARLVQLLEEKGIGRPSTFSTLVDKIQERGYVKKEDVPGKEIVCNDYELENGEISEIETKREFGAEKGKLVIQPLGIIVMEFLEKHFTSIFDYKYTSLMEEALDKIAKGELIWFEICAACNQEVDDLIDRVKNETKYEFQIDENNTFVIGKYGPVIKCVEEKDGKEEISFKSIKKDIDITKLGNGEYVLDDVVDTTKSLNKQYILGEYEGRELVLRKGKYGLYASWGDNSRNLKELGNRPIENIGFEEVVRILDKGSNMVREISASASIRRGPKGDYLFYKAPKMKKPQFYDIKSFISDTKEDYKTCNLTMLKSWIEEKYTVKA